MKNFMQHVAAFALLFAVLLGIAWIAGFPDWSDPFEYDHPENFARHIVGE
jgi:hypothetical protein